MNRKQRRAFGAKMRFSKISSVPREGEPSECAGTCDWPGCQETWMFVTMARVPGKGEKPRPVARRCQEHRIQQ